jgi:hypothetical protein
MANWTFPRKLCDLIWRWGRRRRGELFYRNEFERNIEPRGLQSLIWADQWTGKVYYVCFTIGPVSQAEIYVCSIIITQRITLSSTHSPTQPTHNNHEQNFFHPSYKTSNNLTISLMNFAIFYDMLPCSLYVKRRFGGTYDLYLQGRKSVEQDCVLEIYHVFTIMIIVTDRLCDLVVRVIGYRSGGPGSIPGTTRKKCSGSGTGCTQPCEYNWGATW